MATNTASSRHGSTDQSRHGRNRIAATLAAAFFATVCTVLAQAGPADDHYANPDLLVDVQWLTDQLGSADVLTIDMRNPDLFSVAHVPGAVNLPIGAIVETVDRVPFELDEEAVVGALRAIGMESDHTVVIYDDLGMMNSARLFWTLEYLGHQDARVLDGGWDAWAEEGAPVESGQVRPEPSSYEPSIVSERLIDLEELASRLDDPGLVIADARSHEEYLGEFTFSGRAGRIPGAVHLPWFDALTGGDVAPTTQPGWQAELTDPDVERLRSAPELLAWLDVAGVTPDHEVVTYCQTLWRGAHLYFVLRLMGFEEVRGYDGSWAEWSVMDLPIESGPPN